MIPSFRPGEANSWVQSSLSSHFIVAVNDANVLAFVRTKLPCDLAQQSGFA